MSYKSLLLGRYDSVLDEFDEPAPLNYMDYRNQEALRAWRERYSHPPADTRMSARRTWLSSLRWTAPAALVR